MKVPALLIAATMLVVSGCSGGPGKPAKTITLIPTFPVGTMQGQLKAVGGPPGTASRPLSGKVTIKGGPDSSTIRAEVGPDGRFVVQLSPGTYRLTGRSKDYDGGNADCSAADPKTVLKAGKTVTADIICSQR